MESSFIKELKGKIRSFNCYWYVIKDRKRYLGGIIHAIYWYVKANNKDMKDYDKNKESLYLKYWDVNNLYRWTMSQSCL